MPWGQKINVVSILFSCTFVLPQHNINDHIKKGVQGTVPSFLNGLPVVTTSDGAVSVVVERVTWSVYDRIENHKLVRTRTQIPLKLAWGMTVHKAQGKKLEALEVHCGKEFAPGHLYVAMSRVKSKDDLRVIGFNKNRPIPAAPEVLDFLGNVRNATTQQRKKCCQLTSLSSSTEEELHAQELVSNINAIFTSLSQPELIQSTKVFVSVQWNKIFSLI